MDSQNTEFRQEFQIGQQVVYPSQGVGKIKAIEERNFKGSSTLYYVIYFEVSDMTSMIPVEKAGELGVRAIVSPEEAHRAINFVGEEYEAMPSDWKLRYQQNLDLLKKGSIMDIAAIVRSLYHRSQVKELPIMERKLYDSAKKLMEDEIAFSLNKSRDEVERLIFEQLEVDGGEAFDDDAPFDGDILVEDVLDGTLADDADISVDDSLIEGDDQIDDEGLDDE
jgi:CarD family transcriptional regulator